MSCLFHRLLFVLNAREYSLTITVLSFFPLAFSNNRDAPPPCTSAPIDFHPRPEPTHSTPAPPKSIVPILHFQPSSPPSPNESILRLTLPSSTFVVITSIPSDSAPLFFPFLFSSFFNLLNPLFSSTCVLTFQSRNHFIHYALAYHPSCRPGIQQ